MSWLEHHKATCYSVVSATCASLAGATFLLGVGGPAAGLWIFLGLLAACLAFAELARLSRA